MNLNETLKAIESFLVEQDIDTYTCFECISGTIIYSIQLDGNSVISLETCNEDNMPLTDEKLATCMAIISFAYIVLNHWITCKL